MELIFIVSAVTAVAGAALMVSRRNPVWGLLFLLVCFGGAAGVFYTLSAAFMAVAQILVYAGALSVLFLFVLMFVDLRRKGELESIPARVDSLSVYDPDKLTSVELEEGEQSSFSFPAAIISALIFVLFAGVIFSLEGYSEFTGHHWLRAIPRPAGDDPITFGSTVAFGRPMIDNFALHYEVVGLVVLVGVIGAVVLGKRIAAITDQDVEKDAEARNNTTGA